MKIHEVEQKADAWFACRIGKVTASELGNLLTPQFEHRTGEMPKSYLYAKAAEAYRGVALPGFSTHATEQGIELEDRARSWFAFQSDHVIRNVGFVETDDGKFGCSPDALLDDDNGLELKCAECQTHVKYLLEGKLPTIYRTQVHGSMFATGRPKWTFMSYRPGFAPFVLKVNRDESICAKIAEAVDKFAGQLDSAMSKLREANA